MLDGGLDATYRAVLAGPHTMTVRVEVWDPAVRLMVLDQMDILGGSVSANLVNRVTRNLNLTLSEDWYPTDDDHPLNPWGNEIRAWRGVEYGNGLKVEFPIFRGKIQDVDLAEGGTVEVNAADLAQDVDDADFERPRNSSVGVEVDAQFRELVTEAVPAAEFGPSDVFWQRMPVLTWESDRGAALDEVGETAGAFWFVLPDGRYVMRKVPWTVAGEPTVELFDGEDGLIYNAMPRKTRDGVYNSVTAIGERTDGTPPVYANAVDGDPRSRTYAAGKFGRKHRLLRLQTAASQQSATGAAQDYVRRSRALAETWSWSQVPDPAMELGEVARLNVRGRTAIQVVAAFDMPLVPNGQMTVTGRSQIVGAVEDA